MLSVLVRTDKSVRMNAPDFATKVSTSEILGVFSTEDTAFDLSHKLIFSDIYKLYSGRMSKFMSLIEHLHDEFPELSNLPQDELIASVLRKMKELTFKSYTWKIQGATLWA